MMMITMRFFLFSFLSLRYRLYLLHFILTLADLAKFVSTSQIYQCFFIELYMYIHIPKRSFIYLWSDLARRYRARSSGISERCSMNVLVA